MSLINRAAVKKFALETQRAHKFERVSKEFLDVVEAELRVAVRRRVLTHPSKGKTLKN